MTVKKEIRFLVKGIILSIIMIGIILASRALPAHAAETETETAPELHWGKVLYQDDAVSFFMTEDGDVWSYEGVSLNEYGQAYVLNPYSHTGFDLIEVDTMIGVCLNEEKDGCIIVYNNEPGDPFYNYISYWGLNVSVGDIVETVNYRILGTDDDIIYRDDKVLYNIYAHMH